MDTKMNDLPEDVKNKIAELRHALSLSERNVLDQVSMWLIKHGMEVEKAMFAPYVIYILGMQKAVSEINKAGGLDKVKEMVDKTMN